MIDRWARLMTDHETALDTFVDACRRMPADRWTAAGAPGQWSPAEVVEHLRLSYALVPTSPGSSGGMVVERSPLVAWITRNVALRALLALGVFPTGGRAPREVRPDRAQATAPPRDVALTALRREADRAVHVLVAAGRSSARSTVSHAYFGPMSPGLTLQVVTAHTRHHARRL
jgi:hypothetical protein